MSLTTAILLLCLVGISQGIWRLPRTTKKPVFPFGKGVPVQSNTPNPYDIREDYPFNSFDPDYDYRQPNRQKVRKLGGVGPLTVDKLYLDNHVQAQKVYVQDYYNYDYPNYNYPLNYPEYPAYGHGGLGPPKKTRNGRHGKK